MKKILLAIMALFVAVSCSSPSSGTNARNSKSASARTAKQNKSWEGLENILTQQQFDQIMQGKNKGTLQINGWDNLSPRAQAE